MSKVKWNKRLQLKETELVTSDGVPWRDSLSKRAAREMTKWRRTLTKRQRNSIDRSR